MMYVFALGVDTAGGAHQSVLTETGKLSVRVDALWEGR